MIKQIYTAIVDPHVKSTFVLLGHINRRNIWFETGVGYPIYKKWNDESFSLLFIFRIGGKT